MYRNKNYILRKNKNANEKTFFKKLEISSKLAERRK
jgi:hypothetical protein